MDFKEYIEIFQRNYKTFLTAVFLVMAMGILFQLFRPLSWKAALALNVTRAGSQATADYTYDDFYRLQADEKFADTIVRWLSSDRIVNDIFQSAQVSGEKPALSLFPYTFKAERLSSQFIQVAYVTKDKQSAEKIAPALIGIVNRETQELNKLQKQEQWFTVIGSAPVIEENVFSWSLVIWGAFFAGIFLGFWVVLIKHYFDK